MALNYWTCLKAFGERCIWSIGGPEDDRSSCWIVERRV